MSAREPLSDEELEVLSEKLLAKLLGRLAQRAKAENDEAEPAKPPPKKALPRHLQFRREPPPEAYVDVMNRMRRNGER